MQNHAFPHENTDDQWFSEAQFESYRKLGYSMGIRLFGTAQSAAGEKQKREPKLPFLL